MSEATMAVLNSEEVVNYRMPDVDIGETIVWYPSGYRNTRERSVGTVIKKFNRSIVIRTAFGKVVETVRHADDPKIQISDSQRESGAWEHTEVHKLLQQLKDSAPDPDKMADLVQQITVLKGRVTKLENALKGE